MKQTLIAYALRLAIWVLERYLTKYTGDSKSGKSEKSVVLQEDVVFNPDTAKAFAKFIKEHTVQTKTSAVNGISIHCSAKGIEVEGAPFKGSTCDTSVSSLDGFVRVAEGWWRTYVGMDSETEGLK